MVARHAVTITDLREVQGTLPHEPLPREDEHRIITSLRETLTPAELAKTPQAGGVCMFEPGVRGAPAAYYKG